MPRQRHGSFSETQRSSASAIVNQHSGNFHFRSRSTSGRFRHMKTPGNNPDYFGSNGGSNNHATIHLMGSKSNDQLDNVNNNSNSSEPIYSEPFPPDHQNFDEVSELKSSQNHHQLNSKIINSSKPNAWLLTTLISRQKIKKKIWGEKLVKMLGGLSKLNFWTKL